MRFLADESCDFRVVRALRSDGHDVMAVAEVAPGAEDDAVVQLAVRERRIFVTEDRDFGQLVYASATPTPGVIFIRFPSMVRSSLPAAILDVVTRHGEKLGGRFVVIQPGRVRLGMIPQD